MYSQNPRVIWCGIFNGRVTGCGICSFLEVDVVSRNVVVVKEGDLANMHNTRNKPTHFSEGTRSKWILKLLLIFSLLEIILERGMTAVES